jgi:outer membrane protein OmpA-like peptidoglycan-associated protein
MKSKIILICVFVIGLIMPVKSQSSGLDSLLNKTNIGLKFGLNFPSFSYSSANIQEYSKSILGRGAIGVMFETDYKYNLSFRPEFLYIGKGEKINDLGISYKMKSKYYDLRIPVLYTYKHWKNFYPYVLLGPTISFAKGGNIELDGISTAVTKANLASVDFGFFAGLGVKYPFVINNIPLLFSGEIAYNKGLVDTYGTQEKNNSAIVLNKNPGTIDGTRKNKGVEITVSVSIPLSKLIPKRKPKTPETIVIEPDTTFKIPVKPCYTIAEVESYIKRKLNVTSLKICMYSINFETNKYDLKAASLPYLDEIVSLLQSDSKMKMKINGHTDNVGSVDKNLILSQNRAKAVYDYLISKGISTDRVSYEGFGSSKPIDTNESDSGKFNNRRVEFEIVNEG